MINRGNYRKNLFAGKGAAESFERCLFEAAERFGWRVHAYVIMRNHFHLAVETPEPNLSDGMRWLQGTWVARFNRFSGETGRPFQGRYKALHVEPGHALAQVAHYIHLNPVRAKIVRADDLACHRWSSLHHFPQRERPPCLAAETVLAESGRLPDTAAGWRRYRAYLAHLAEEDLKWREKRFGRLSRGWAIGSPGFRHGLRKELEGIGAGPTRFELLGVDRAALHEARAEFWEEKLRRAAGALGIPLGKLPTKYSDPGKVALAALMKQTTSVSNGWLAERLQMGRPASVSQFVRRFCLSGGTSRHEFQRARAARR
ncbi:transposase [Oleiharenicola sp. Vm1]|uniref:transposase n=1 Tax=Oleiharenicola sp. Vm1 TaxID=3398393 RepID=UPI0039F63B6B